MKFKNPFVALAETTEAVAVEVKNAMIPLSNSWNGQGFGMVGGAFNEAGLPGNWPDSWTPSTWPTTSGYDVAGNAGDPRTNSLVSGLQMMQIKAAVEAPPVIMRRDSLSHWGYDIEHPILDLLEQPTNWWDWKTQFGCLLCELTFRGNAYQYILRNIFGEPMELLWIPARDIWPRWEPDTRNFIDWYQYRPSGQGKFLRLETKDIIHHRAEMVNPWNDRLSYSRLQALNAELCVDKEDTISAASWAHNMGIPGAIATPEASMFENANITEDTVKRMQKQYRADFGGRNIGRLMVADFPWKFDTLNFKPEELVTKDAVAKAESRICMAFSISPAVASALLGLEKSKGVALKEYNEMFYEMAIMPLWNSIGSELTQQLLVSYEGKKNQFDQIRVPRSVKLSFDVREVRALLQDKLEEAKMNTELYRWGIKTRGESRMGIGLDPGEDPDVYYTDIIANMSPGGGTGMAPSGGGNSEDGGGLEDGQNPASAANGKKVLESLGAVALNGAH